MRRIAACALVLLLGCRPALAVAADGQAPSSTNKSGPAAAADNGAEPSADPGGWVKPAPPPPQRTPNVLRAPIIGDFVRDQKAIWTAPLNTRLQDFTWMIPLAGVTAGLLVSDAQFARHVHTAPTRTNHYDNISTAGVGALVGVGGGLFFLGLATHDDKKRETGWLAGQAFVNSYALAALGKAITGRERPLEGNGDGSFRSGGNSFPSEHAAAAWSIASVIAHEYPGPLTQLFAYGTAAAVSAARVKARQHFPSDVVVGSALGWYVGRQVVRAHREEESGDGAQYGQFIRDERERSPLEMASPYVPLDSWVYDAFDRLAAMGHLRTAFAGLKPWTRMECARLAAEAGDQLGPDDDGGAVQARALQHALADEFAPEVARLAGGDNFGAQVDSVYVRFTGISGTPLRDSYHFGQTIVNDYGRPYGEGFNSVTGFSSHAVAGPLAIYLSGEYQYSPGPKPYSDAVKNAIGAFHADDTFSPLGISQPGGPANRFETLDAYAVLNVRGYQLSFGKQSGWWSPDHSGSFLLSTNAEPMYMLRLNRTTPARLPWIFSALGPMRTEFFLARQSGVHRGNSETGVIISPDASFDPQPFIHGQKISFKPTPNFEFSISRTTLMGGPKFPFTTRRFINSLFSTANSFGPDDPGDRRSAVDFTWRVPKLRKWLVFYNDAFAEDEISPIAYPRRSAMNPGIYMPQIPKLPKLDFRAEGVFTDLPAGLLAPGFSYKSARYPDGYTNAGQLLGHWVGRQGSGMQFWSTYWLAPRNKVQIGYRQQWVDKDFLQGGSLQDFSARGEFMLRPDLGLTTNVQYENWKFPLLAPGKQSNFSTSVQFTWFPKWGKK